MKNVGSVIALSALIAVLISLFIRWQTKSNGLKREDCGHPESLSNSLVTQEGTKRIFPSVGTQWMQESGSCCLLCPHQEDARWGESDGEWRGNGNDGHHLVSWKQMFSYRAALGALHKDARPLWGPCIEKEKGKNAFLRRAWREAPWILEGKIKLNRTGGSSGKGTYLPIASKLLKVHGG